MVNKLIIPKSEVLRYLGHKNQIISENLDSLVEQCIEECKKLIMPKFIKREYNIMPTNVDLTKYTSPKKYGIYLQEKKHKRKRKW